MRIGDYKVMVLMPLLLIILTVYNPTWGAQPQQPNTAGLGAGVPGTKSSAKPAIAIKPEGNALELEREKLDFQKHLEDQKLQIEREKVWASSLAVGVPLLIGVITLIAQGIQRRRDTIEAFELKAVEIIFSGDSPVATKNRAAALRKLFPDKFSEDFGSGFEPSQFAGPRYEAKLEVFKAACEKAGTSDEVYKIWAMVFPGDDWIKPLVTTPGGRPVTTQNMDTSFGANTDADGLSKAEPRSAVERIVGYSNNF